MNLAEVSLATAEDGPGWDAYVRAHPGAGVFHRACWARAVVEAYGYKDESLVAYRGGKLVGILPLIALRMPMLGERLVSTAFGVGGGPLADDDDAMAALLGAAEMRAVMRPRCKVELRSDVGTRRDWIRHEGKHAGFVRRLAADDDANLKLIPRKQRAVVRKALDSDLTVTHDDHVDHLHRVYAESVRNLGTPVFPRRWFASLQKQFGGDAVVTTVHAGGQPVASVLSLVAGDTIQPYYGGGVASARQSGANDLMYWSVMKLAAGRGIARFDFGRSKVGSGAFNFKRNWGFEPTPLVYSSYEPGRTETSKSVDLSPANPLFALPIKVWQRLPLPVANFVGPHIARYLA